MKYKFYFQTEEELVNLKEINKDKYVIEIAYLKDLNFIIFSDEEIVDSVNNEILENRISILEAENETLKQELSITQDAVNELIFNSLNI